MSDELKIVINIKGDKGLIGIQSPDCDPQIHTFEGELAHALESVPGFVEEARQTWAEHPRYPKCATDLTPPTPPRTTSAAAAAAKPKQQPSMF